jgi:hypothetical protein
VVPPAVWKGGIANLGRAIIKLPSPQQTLHLHSLHNTTLTYHDLPLLSNTSILIMEFVASNATILSQPETYFGIYNELSKYNVHLNIFERLWAVSSIFL